MQQGHSAATEDGAALQGGKECWENHEIGLLHAADDPESSSLHNSFRTDVTGVSGLTMSSAYGGSIPLQPGELAESVERPLSAPPPPGFAGMEAADERNRKASEMILRPNGSRDEEYVDEDTQQRNFSSFSNLAAVLGTGLAQSMEDATLEREAAFDDLNFHRQTRHAASRLIGSSGAGDPAASNNHQNKSKKEDYSLGEGFGFPSSLSSPQKQRKEHYSADKTSNSSYPGQASGKKDFGTRVNEPEGDFASKDSPPRRQNNAGPSLDQDQTMLSSTAREFRPTPASADSGIPGSNESSMSDSANSIGLTSRQAEAELKPFLWDVEQSSPSRSLVILHVSYLRAPDVRSSCEQFGVLEGFRADFSSSGIYFVSYYDIRSAQYAAQELQAILQRLSVMQRSNEEVVVRFCLPLNSSSQFDDGQLVISELPPEVNEYALKSMLSSYGSIRSIVPQTIGAYLIEFHNTQDAKQAQLELDSTQPFGPNTFVEMAMRNQIVRKKGRALLSLIGRWRQSLGNRQEQQPQIPSHPPAARPEVNQFSSTSSDPWRNNHSSGGAGSQQQHSIASSLMSAPTEVVGMGAAYGATAGGQQHFNNHSMYPQETTQLVLGPDGRYTPVVVQNQMPFSSFAPPGATAVDPRQQQIIQGPNGQIYLAPVPAASQSSMFAPQISMRTGGRGGNSYPATIVTNGPPPDRRAPQSRTPYYNTDAASLASGRSHRSAYSSATEGEKDTRHLLLDLDAVENGRDARTSLMVRNIPNKYTQQMLLSEFDENGHGPGVIDFFYLPIDFKNRCNRGYAFINFVDYRDILPFHQRYFGKHWRTFNSDKICDITYARIQGKAAMLKRFENSALMEKDDEYKPLVFASSGPEKGKRLPFPEPKAN